MKKMLYVALISFSLILLDRGGWAIEPYHASVQEILDVKDLIDDPAPFYKDCDNFKKWIPPEVWEQVTYDVEEMKNAWSETVGFKAPDVVGKIAPEITPGKYTLADKERHPFDQLMIPLHYQKFNNPGEAGFNHIGYYTEFEIIPTRQYYYSLPVAEATLKNRGKTKQDDQGYIIPESFEDGYPFPRPSGNHKAMQILYNHRKKYVFMENTLMYDISVGVNKNWKIDHRGDADWSWMRPEGRVNIPPYGWLDKRAEEQGEENIQIFIPFSPRDIYGNVYQLITYNNPNKETVVYAYVNMLRRIRKLSSSDKQDQAAGQDVTYDETDGFTQTMSPKYYPYKYKVVEEREFLVPAYDIEGKSWVDSKEKFKYKDLEFERRPMWVVEMDQQDPNYIYGRRIAYFDKETLLGLLWLCYDQKGRLYRGYDDVYGFIEPMGMYNFFHIIQADFIDVHSMFFLDPSYPALWYERDDFTLRTMLKAK